MAKLLMGKEVGIKSKTISATVSSSSTTGNASLNLRTADIAILSLYTHTTLSGGDCIICEPTIYNNGWYAHLTNASTGAIVPGGTSASIEVIYVDVSDVITV